MHLIAANDHFAVTFSFSGGNADDVPEGRALMESCKSPLQSAATIMDRACEGEETRQLMFYLGMTLVILLTANGVSNGTTTVQSKVVLLFWTGLRYS